MYKKKLDRAVELDRVLKGLASSVPSLLTNVTSYYGHLFERRRAEAVEAMDRTFGRYPPPKAKRRWMIDTLFAGEAKISNGDLTQ